MINKIPTLGPIGYLPAPGTMATLATLPFMILAHICLPYPAYLGLCVAVFFFGMFIIKKTKDFFGDVKDPSCIVIDEVAGCLFTFVCISLNIKTVVLGFILFRLFDIFKLGLIKRCEGLPGAWGVMGDDLAAAMCANVVMQLLIPFLM